FLRMRATSPLIARLHGVSGLFMLLVPPANSASVNTAEVASMTASSSCISTRVPFLSLVHAYRPMLSSLLTHMSMRNTRMADSQNCSSLLAVTWAREALRWRDVGPPDAVLCSTDSEDVTTTAAEVGSGEYTPPRPAMAPSGSTASLTG